MIQVAWLPVSPLSDSSQRLGGTAAMRRAAALREMGVNIAVDDFGTGYSSLGYLAKLTVNALKIDRAFVATMASDAHSMTLVSGIISLARSLDLKVIAEGVGTEEQAKLLCLLKCDELQCYLLGRPLPADEVPLLSATSALQGHDARAGGGADPPHVGDDDFAVAEAHGAALLEPAYLGVLLGAARAKRRRQISLRNRQLDFGVMPGCQRLGEQAARHAPRQRQGDRVPVELGGCNEAPA